MEFVLNDEVQDEAGFLELLSSDLKPFYEPRLPYHNWDEHIEQGLGIIDNLCEQEKAKGNPISSFMAKVAYMGHDAGFPHDLITPDIWKKYGSKEGMQPISWVFSCKITGWKNHIFEVFKYA